MNIKALKTHPIEVGESLITVLDTYLPHLNESSIVAITSKIISLCQGRVIHQKEVDQKYDLVKQEADAFLEKEQSIHNVYLTLTNHILIPSAGIDESNGNGFYILYPKDIQATATMVWEHLRQRDSVKELGVIITDSHTTPLRRGVTGIAIGWCGFDPLYNYIGQPDIFGKPLKVTQINHLDALAASAVLIMGEGAEQTPLALITQVPKIRFLSHPPTIEDQEKIKIPLKEDLYAPLLQGVKWIWNQNKI